MSIYYSTTKKKVNSALGDIYGKGILFYGDRYETGMKLKVIFIFNNS